MMFDQLPLNQNLQFVAGDDFSFPWTLGVPTSGYAFFGHIRLTASGVQNFTIDNNDLINGQVSLNLDEAETAAIEPGVYDWTFGFTTSAGFRQTYFDGLCTVIAPV